MTDIEYLEKYLDRNNLEDGIKRLKRGEPVQYIVGNIDFYGLLFDIDKNVLIPRFETEELVGQTIQYVKKRFQSRIDILDIGTGSGCIAITLEKKLNANVDAIDISTSALKVAEKNKIKNNSNVHFFESDIYSNVVKKYDLIISNPPYIGNNEEIMEIVKNNEPSIALYGGDDGLYFYRKILKEAKKYLKEKSMIALEIGSFQEMEIRKIIDLYFPKSIVISKKDYNQLDRYIFIFNEIEE